MCYPISKCAAGDSKIQIELAVGGVIGIEGHSEQALFVGRAGEATDGEEGR